MVRLIPCVPETFHGRIPATPKHPAEREKISLVPRVRVLSKQQKTVQTVAWREEEKSSAFAIANTIPTHLHFQRRYCQHSTYASSCFLKSLIESHNLYRLPTNETEKKKQTKQSCMSVLACAQTLFPFSFRKSMSTRAKLARESERGARKRGWSITDISPLHRLALAVNKSHAVFTFIRALDDLLRGNRGLWHAMSLITPPNITISIAYSTVHVEPLFTPEKYFFDTHARGPAQHFLQRI